jgi:WD40 repeat protein
MFLHVTGKELPSWPYPKSFANALAFSPDGAILATGDFNQETIRLWNAVTGELIRILPEFANYGLAFSPDSKILAAGGIPRPSDQITLWKVSDGTKILSFEDTDCYSLAFNGKVLASAVPTYHDHKTKYISSGPTIWDLSTGKTWLIEVVRKDSNTVRGSRCVALSPDGNTLAYDDGPFIERWDLRTGKRLPSFTESAVVSKK